MIDPLLNEKHQELREQVRAFAEEEIKPVAAELDEKSGFSTETNRQNVRHGPFAH